MSLSPFLALRLCLWLSLCSFLYGNTVPLGMTCS